MEIVTGNTGRTHVTPIDDAVRNSHLALITERVVYSVPNYESFRAQDVTANEVRVYSGYGSNQGRIFKIDENDFDSVTIENGSVNTKRMDLIVARYTMNQQTGFENISLVVIKGTTGADYTEPEHETGNINSGAVIDDFVLYKVYIDGIAIDHLEKMFEPLPDGGYIGEVKALMDTINDKIDLIPFDLDEAVNKSYVDNEVSKLQTNFRGGVDTIRNAIVATGVTPAASTPSALAAAVDDVYNLGVMNGRPRELSYEINGNGATLTASIPAERLHSVGVTRRSNSGENTYERLHAEWVENNTPMSANYDFSQLGNFDTFNFAGRENLSLKLEMRTGSRAQITLDLYYQPHA